MRQDASAFKGFAPGSSFALPANARIGVRASAASRVAGVCLTAKGRAVNAPALAGERIHWVGWFEKDVPIVAGSGYEFVIDAGGGVFRQFLAT